MANVGEIKVVITESSNTETITPNGQTQVSQSYSQKKDLTSKTKIQGQGLSIPEATSIAYLVSTAKQAGSMALSNVGRYTGSSETQTNVSNLMQGVGLGVALYAHPIAALTSVAFTMTQTILDEEFRKKQEQMSLNINRSRNGYTDAKSILTSRRH